MRPYPGCNLPEDKKIFNYRLSRARRTVENVFGILAARFRLYHRKINLDPDNINLVIQATCVLHNYLQNSTTAGSGELALPATQVTADGLNDIEHVGNHSGNNACHVRDSFKAYFTSETGALHWQYNVVRRGMAQS